MPLLEIFSLTECFLRRLKHGRFVTRAWVRNVAVIFPQYYYVGKPVLDSLPFNLCSPFNCHVRLTVVFCIFPKHSPWCATTAHSRIVFESFIKKNGKSWHRTRIGRKHFQNKIVSLVFEKFYIFLLKVPMFFSLFKVWFTFNQFKSLAHIFFQLNLNLIFIQLLLIYSSIAELKS